MKLVSLENITKYNELLNKKIVKSVNSVKPDSNGNVTLGTEKSTFNKVVYDTGYFSIGTNKSYSFDLTGSDIENVSKENVNIRLVAKVITAGDGFQVDDIVQLTPTLDANADYDELDICSYIRGNTLCVYSGHNTAFSINSGTGWVRKPNVQIKAVLTAFVPDDGSILLIAEDQTNTSKLVGLPNGTLTWKDKNIVRSVNGVNADENGNVKIDISSADIDTSEFVKSVNGSTPDSTGNISIDIPSTDGMVKSVNSQIPDSNGNVDITIPEVDLSGLVKSVNSITPDENGNVSLNVFTTPGNIIKWESDYFDISPSKTLSFDLTGTVFENEERSNINFQLVAKVKKGNNILQAGDTLFTDYNNYVGNAQASEIGSYSYIRDKKLYIHFGNDTRFVITASDGNTAKDVSKSDVQCKIILTKVVSGSNGEIGATPKSITNIVGVTDNRNLGEIFYSTLPQTSSQVHLLDGSVLTDATELYDYLESIKDSNPDLFTTDSEFNSEVESTSKCSKFVIGTDNKTVRIPKGDSNNYIVIKSFDKKFEFNQPFSLLEPKWSDVPLNNPSWLLSNGQVNSQENYPSVYELLLNEYNNGTLKSETIGDTTISYKQLDNGHKVVTDKTAYESILKNTGTAWYYLLDLDSRTFVLPQTNGYMKYGNSNQFIKQSLPNIKGQTAWTMTSGDDETTPPFSKIFTSSYGVPASSGAGKFTRIKFDASTSSDIYADGANVNPNSVQGYLYFYVGECVGTSNSVNLGDIKDKLDLDITNLKTELNKLKGNIIKWETDYFDIAPSGLYSFDLSNTPFANIPREAINIQMVGKVKTAQNGFKVDDYVYPQFCNFVGKVSKNEAGSTPYISGNVLSIRFGDDDSFVIPGPNGGSGTSWLGKTNVKVKLILTALIEEV